MQTRNEPLTKRERTELHGYVAWTTVAGRALLFLVALVVVGAVCRRVQQWLPLRGPYWLLPTIAWREFEIRESAHSRRFLGLKRLGEPFRPFTDRPPRSRDQFTQLGLSSVGRWQRLEVPFDDLRQVA